MNGQRTNDRELYIAVQYTGYKNERVVKTITYTEAGMLLDHFPKPLGPIEFRRKTAMIVGGADLDQTVEL